MIENLKVSACNLGLAFEQELDELHQQKVFTYLLYMDRFFEFHFRVIRSFLSTIVPFF